MNNVKKAAALLLALALIFALPVPASAAETTEARVPVTLTVVNTVSPISCTVPAALPVSLVDGYVVCANNAAITNTGKTGAIRVTKVDVQAGTFEIGNFDDFTASKNSIALSINGCSTKGAGSLTLVDGAFPAISAEKSLAIRYKAKVSASEAVTNVNPLCAEALLHILIINDPHHRCFVRIDCQLKHLMLALVEAPALYKVVPIRSEAALEAAVLDELAEGGFCTDRGFFAFAVGLPEADVIGELVRVIIKPLFTLLRTPDPDAVLDKPFHHKGRFICDAPDAVKHEHKQNIEFSLLGAFLDDLQLVPVFGPDLMPGYAILLFFVNNGPAHFFTEAMTLSALHGNVGLAFVVVVHLLVGGHTVQAIDANHFRKIHKSIFHCIDPSFLNS